MSVGGYEDLYLQQLQADSPVRGLKLGHKDFQPLKSFFERDAKAYERQGLGRTYVVSDVAGNKPKAFITLVCGEVSIDEAGKPLVSDTGLHYPYKHYPAIKIARLAVDKRFQGNGVGRELINIAFAITKEQVCSVVGCRFVMVDAKKASIDFYLRCGFTMVGSLANKRRDNPVMYVDLSKLD